MEKTGKSSNISDLYMCKHVVHKEMVQHSCHLPSMITSFVTVHKHFSGPSVDKETRKLLNFEICSEKSFWLYSVCSHC